MKFVTNIAMVDPSFYVLLAQAAEDAGFDAVALADSIGYPQESDTVYPYNADGSREFLENKPFLEPIVAMAAMAAATSTITFTPFVLKLPVRHPVMFAKQLTSLAVLSGNRIRLGAGTSPWPDDYALVGLPWERRGKRFLECYEILRGLETGEYFEYHGEFYDFDAVKINPVPTEPVPILIGGISAALMDRAARIGDGWLPASMTRERLREGIDTVNTLRAEYGRDHLPFDIWGSGVRSVEEVRELEELGVTHVFSAMTTFNPYNLAQDSETLTQKIDALKRFGETVIAKHRG